MHNEHEQFTKFHLRETNQMNKWCKYVKMSYYSDGGYLGVKWKSCAKWCGQATAINYFVPFRRKPYYETFKSNSN